MRSQKQIPSAMKQAIQVEGVSAGQNNKVNKVTRSTSIGFSPSDEQRVEQDEIKRKKVRMEIQKTKN